MPEVTALNHLILRRVQPLQRASAIGTRVDPVLLEVFNNLFMSIAEQMGVTPANTATSVNIKERLDFSCALFDEQGNLIANAPHMPVHLGSMGESVQDQRDAAAVDGPGDVYVECTVCVVTHLPDVMADARVSASCRSFYVAARGHHADIGGITLGSMPSHSAHTTRRACCSTTSSSSRRASSSKPSCAHCFPAGPSRPQRRAESRRPARAGRGLPEGRSRARRDEHFGLQVVQAYMQHVQDNAEEAVRRVIDALTDGDFEYAMDNGARVRVSIRIGALGAHRLQRTSAQQANFNAPVSVTRAAVLYVFRTLVNDEIPTNAAALPLEVFVPGRLDAQAAVSGGSRRRQRRDFAGRHDRFLYGALGVLRGPGHDEQLHLRRRRTPVLRNHRRRLGRRPDSTELSVQTHMTNSRLTDPEVLEWRFRCGWKTFASGAAPVEQCAIGAGDGSERRVRFRRR